MRPQNESEALDEAGVRGMIGPNFAGCDHRANAKSASCRVIHKPGKSGYRFPRSGTLTYEAVKQTTDYGFGSHLRGYRRRRFRALTSSTF